MCRVNYSSIIFILLCSAWLISGQDDEIFTIQMDPLPSKNIYAILGEYITVSLNVEYRQNSTCTIEKICHVDCEQKSDLVKENYAKFERVGACGYRILADDLRNHSWKISQKTGNYLRYGLFDVTIQTNSLIERLSFYENTSAVIPLDSVEKSFCKIKTLNTVKRIYTSKYFIKNIDKTHEGHWEVEYYNNSMNNNENSEKLIYTKIYYITVENKPDVVVDIFIDDNMTTAEVECKTKFENVKQCSFEGPSGTIINELLAANNLKYSFEKLNKIENIDDFSSCILIINNFTTQDSGAWKCSIRDDMHTLNTSLFIGDESMTSLNYIFKTIDGEFNINCTTNEQWQACYLQQPDGHLDFFDKNDNKIKSVLNNDNKTCSLNINQAKIKHTGNWTCKVMNIDGITETKKIFVVQITNDKIIPIIRYEIVDDKNETILEATPFPVDDEKIDKCIWKHPYDDDLNDDEKYIIDINNKTCSLRIKNIEKTDKGTWICRIKLLTSNNVTLTRSAYFDLHQPETTFQFVWTITEWSATMFLLVVIIVAIFLSDSCCNTIVAVKNDETKSSNRLLKDHDKVQDEIRTKTFTESAV